MIIKEGDIFLTRNEGDDETVNTSPGFWNHAAICGSDGETIIEAQSNPGKVLQINGYDFVERYPTVKIIRLNLDGLQLAKEAEKLVGSPYRKIASVFKHLRRNHRGENCVSVIRKAIRNTTGRDPGLFKPDDILLLKHEVIWEKS